MLILHEDPPTEETPESAPVSDEPEPPVLNPTPFPK